MPSAFASIAPLTLTLSPEGRGDVGVGAAGIAKPSTHAEVVTSPLRGEVAAQRRVRGPRAEPAQIDRARTLRSAMTDAEARLWYHLRDRLLAGHKFVRQLPVAGYYADFACKQARLIVEAGGGQHGGSRDIRRDAALQAEGFNIMRFWNNDILRDTESVLRSILDTLQTEE